MPQYADVDVHEFRRGARVIRIRRTSLLEGARAATGTAVVIDVFRAFTTAAFCVAAGAREIVLVRDPEEALAMKANDPALFLTGEVGGRPIAGFDAGNSPSAIEGLKLEGRRVIQRSSSGTQGVVAAALAGQIYLGSFVTASATCRAVATGVEVTLVAMGDGGLTPCPEDELCGAYLEMLLRGGRIDPAPMLAQLRWEREWPDWFPRRDAELACEIDRFDFALPVTREDGLLIARPVRPV